MTEQSSNDTKHQSLGIVDEINVAIDEGDNGWVRMNIVSESGDSTSALIPKDVAHNAALELSLKVVDRRSLNSESDHD